MSTEKDPDIHTPDADPNVSILKKVRSRVSSILPNSFSKWFSPTSANNSGDTSSGIDTRNGSLRRRRDSDLENEIITPERILVSDAPPNKRNKSSYFNEYPRDNVPTAVSSRSGLSETTGYLTKTTTATSYKNFTSTPTASSVMSNRRNILGYTQYSQPYDFLAKNSNLSSRQLPTVKVTHEEEDDVEEQLPPKHTNDGDEEDDDDEEEEEEEEDDDDYLAEEDINRQNRNILHNIKKGIQQRRPIKSVLNRSEVTTYSSTRFPEKSQTGLHDIQNRLSSFGRNCWNSSNRYTTTTAKQLSASFSHSNDNCPPSNLADDTLPNDNVEVGETNLTNGNDSASESSASISSASVNLNLFDKNLQSVTNRCDAEDGTDGHSSGRKLSGLFATKSGGNTNNLRHTNSAINFASHLQTEKSLFSDKNISNSLNNSTTSLNSLSRKRSFNTSLYGSTSALSDSRLLNTRSPFYNGRTMFGGASSAYNNQTNSNSFTKTMRIPVQMRPSSSLSTLSSSTNSLAAADSATTALSNTAKRILDLMNQFPSPLSDIRKMASGSLNNKNIPALVAHRKRFSDADLSLNRSKSYGVRMTMPKTPYSRPDGKLSSSVSLNPNATHELQVPSMSQLLQMKKLQNNTEQVRKMATTSNSVLNREQEYRLPESNKSDNDNKNSYKIRNKISKSSRQLDNNNGEDKCDNMMPQVTLPDIQLPLMKSVPKIDIAITPSSIPVISSTPAATKVTTMAKGEEPSSKLMMTDKSIDYQFSSPIKIITSLANNITPLNNFKFSDPTFLLNNKSTSKVSATFKFTPETAKMKPKITTNDNVIQNTTPTALKVGSSVMEALQNRSPLTANTTDNKLMGNSFGDKFKPASNTWECSVCMIRNKEDILECVACKTQKPSSGPATLPTPTLAQPLAADQNFKNLIQSQNSKWECSDCLTRNDQSKEKCMCCEKVRPGEVKKTSFSSPASTLTAPSFGFGNLVAQQKAQWECTDCMTRNDQSQEKCACCEQARPGTSTSQGFGKLVEQQKAQWECTACMARNDQNRQKCACCDESKPGSGNDNVPQFSFGTKSAAPSSLLSETTPQFTFGIQPGTAETPAKSLLGAATSVAPTQPSGGFTFGTAASAPTLVDGTVKQGGFSFGIPSKAMSFGSTKSAELSKDINKSDSNVVVDKTVVAAPTPPSGGFKFPASTIPNLLTTDDKSSPKFSFGSSPLVQAAVAAPITENKIVDKSNISQTDDKKTSSNMENVKPLGGFTFGSKQENLKPLQPASFTTPVASKSEVNSSMFTFGAAAAAKPTVASTSLTTTTTTTAATVTTPSSTISFGGVKPTGGFAFDSSTSSPSTTVAPVVSSAPIPIFGTFSTTNKTENNTFVGFGGQTSENNITPSFGVSTSAPVTTTSTVTSIVTEKAAAAPSLFKFDASAKSTTKEENKNFVFGGTTAGVNVLGAVKKPDAAQTSVFGQFVGNAPTAPSFGSLQQQQQQQQSQSGASTVFNYKSSPASAVTTASTVTASAPATTMPFGFGGAGTANQPTFGSIQQQQQPPPPSYEQFTQQNTQSGLPPMGTFGTPSHQTSSSAFGAPAVLNTSPFGSATNNPPLTFGSLGNARTAASIFGSSPTNLQPQGPVFGSPSSGSMHGVGGTTGSIAGGNTRNLSFGHASPFDANDGPSSKKSSNFAFGSNQNVAQAPFAFGSSNVAINKQPFSFSASTTPSFNFTGAGVQTNQSQPFTFGDAGNPSVYNFGGSAATGTETGTNAPAFQFGATNNNNPFAVTPSGQSSSQQQRRKIKAVRRTNPR